jgi:hypothetical protein
VKSKERFVFIFVADGQCSAKIKTNPLFSGAAYAAKK